MTGKIEQENLRTGVRVMVEEYKVKNRSISRRKRYNENDGRGP